MALKDWVERRRQDAQARRTRAALQAQDDRVRVAEEAVAARKELVDIRQEDRDRAAVAELRRERFRRTRTGRLAKGLSSFAAEAGKGMAADIGGARKKATPVKRRKRRKAAPVKRRKGSKRKAPVRRRRSRRAAPVARRKGDGPFDMFGGI